MFGQAEINEESDLKGGWSSMDNYLPAVKVQVEEGTKEKGTNWKCTKIGEG